MENKILKIKNLIKENNFITENLKQKLYKINYQLHSFEFMNFEVSYLSNTNYTKLFQEALQFFYNIYQINKKIQIYIIMSEYKKEINENKILNSENINSGCTYVMKDTILIWRKEEVIKVLFHELVHVFNLDYKKIDTKINEAYTELIASVIHTLFYAKIKNKNFKECYKKEQKFFLKQVIKILKFYNLKQLDNFEEETHVFSYYIGKYFLSFYIKELFIKNEKLSENKFMEIYKRALQNKKIINLINSKLQDKSLRMSFFMLI